MELLLQQILAGLATGTIYACIALAIVMTYQAIGHLNFAQGEMAMFSTFIAWQLIQWGTPYWMAFVVTVALSFAGGVLIERIVLRPIQHAPVLSHVAVFIGLFAILNSLAGFIWDFNVKPFPTPFGSAPLFENGFIAAHQAGMIVITLLVLAFLYVFFRFTRVGLAMRAAANDPVSARLVGIRVGLDDGARLGDGRGYRRDRRHDDRPHRLSRAEHDARASCSMASPAPSSAAWEALPARSSAD